jgi:hypothetical protein
MNESGEYPIFYDPKRDESERALRDEFDRLLHEAVKRCAGIQ